MSRQNATPASLHDSLPSCGQNLPLLPSGVLSTRVWRGLCKRSARCLPFFFCWYIYSVLVKVVFTLCLLVISAAAIGSGASVKRASLPLVLSRVQFVSFRVFSSFLSETSVHSFRMSGSFLSESSVSFRAFGSVSLLDSGGRSHCLATVSMMDLATMTIWYMSSAQVHS